jgi:integrase
MSRQNRRYGEGSIYRRNDGRWAGALVVGTTENGKPRRRTVYGRSRREVAEKLARLQVDRLDGVLSDPTKLRLGEYLNHWLENVSRPRTRASTHALYGRLVGHINKHASGVRLSKLSPLHLEALQRALEQKGVGARTRQAVHRLLHRALGDAQRRGLIRVNVAAAVDAPQVAKKEIRILDERQTKKLLEAAAEEPRIGPLVTLMATTGLRLGEALGLRWRDLDLKGGKVRVERTLVEVNGDLSFHEPKTKRSQRQVGIPNETLKVLRGHRSRLPGLPHPERLVFCDAKGGPWRRSNLTRREWHPLLEKAELPRIGLHALRHGHATALLAGGANPRAVADRLGHSQPSLVLDVYAHTLPGADRELTDRVEALLAGPR